MKQYIDDIIQLFAWHKGREYTVDNSYFLILLYHCHVCGIGLQEKIGTVHIGSGVIDPLQEVY